MDSTVWRRLDFSVESAPPVESSWSATFTARSAHAEGVHPRLAVQSDGAALCSSPAFTANHWRRGFEPNDLQDIRRAANAISSSTVSAGSARRRLDSTGPGRADLLAVSSTVLTWLVSAQIVPGIDVSDLSTPTTAGCLQPSRRRLRIRDGAHRRPNCPLGWCGVVLASGNPQPAIGDEAPSSRPARHAAGGECYRQQHGLDGL